MGGGLRYAMFALLSLAVLASAVAVVLVTHESRRLFVELQAEQKVRDRLSVEWGQLQLEQSTWATHARIERLAREELHMEIPSPENIVLVTP